MSTSLLQTYPSPPPPYTLLCLTHAALIEEKYISMKWSSLLTFLIEWIFYPNIAEQLKDLDIGVLSKLFTKTLHGFFKYFIVMGLVGTMYI